MRIGEETSGMTTELIITEKWYTSLIDELQDIITETSFTSRWTLVEGYHQVGKRILQENDNFERAKIYNEKILQRIAESLGKSQRTLYYAVQFAKTFPDLNLLPEGKNLSWRHVINKYLTDGTEKKVVKKADLYRMIKEIKELLDKELAINNQIALDSQSIIEKSKAITKRDFIRYLQDQVNKITQEGI